MQQTAIPVSTFKVIEPMMVTLIVLWDICKKYLNIFCCERHNLCQGTSYTAIANWLLWVYLIFNFLFHESLRECVPSIQSLFPAENTKTFGTRLKVQQNTQQTIRTFLQRIDKRTVRIHHNIAEWDYHFRILHRLCLCIWKKVDHADNIE